MFTRVCAMLIGVALILSIAPSGNGEVPPIINYQGRLTDAGGTPLTGSYALTFAIFDVSVGGTALWSEAHTAVSVDDGLFSVMLGSSTPLPADLFASPARFLGIKIGLDPELTPRTRIVSVGYSFSSTFSDTAEFAHNTLSNASGWTDTGPSVVLTNPSDNVGIGTTPLYELHVLGQVISGSANLAPGGNSTISGGSDNEANGQYSVIAGGRFNVAALGYSTIGGGDRNHADSDRSTIAGGEDNYTGSSFTAIGGGWFNRALSPYVAIGGGSLNSAQGENAWIGGGYGDTVIAPFGGIACGFDNQAGDDMWNDTAAFVGSGRRNAALDKYAVVTGGRQNTAQARASVVAGGEDNSATGDYSMVGGGHQNVAGQQYTFIGGGEDNATNANYSTIGGGDRNTTDGDRSVIAGGEDNTTMSSFSAIGGGWFNTVHSPYSTVAGGSQNQAWGENAIVAGGYSGTAQGPWSGVSAGWGNVAGDSQWDDSAAYVGGGYNNQVLAKHSAVCGGRDNTIEWEFDFIGGGQSNLVLGSYSSILGGQGGNVHSDYSAIVGGSGVNLSPTCTYSIAFGQNVQLGQAYAAAFFNGSFSGALGVNRDAAAGGINFPIHVGTNATNGNGAHLTPGGVWVSSSSRTFKENFTTLPRNELLTAISSISVSAWNYKGSTERHIGPVAEEFVELFDVGTVLPDGARQSQYLAVGDVAGVALAGVQELLEIIEELKQQNTDLERRLRQLEAAGEVRSNK